MNGSTLDRSAQQLDVLFVSEAPPWPLDQGFRIRGYHMARALQQAGVRVGVASHESLPADAPADLQALWLPWPHASLDDQAQFMVGWSGPCASLRRRLARHQGCQLSIFAGIVPLVARHRPTTVIGLGQHGPMMLRGLTNEQQVKRIWYAADELVRFHLSCIRSNGLAGVPQRLRLILIYAALETLFARRLDGAIGVNPTDTKMLRRIAGVRSAVTIRNGVDTDYFQPATQAPSAKSLIFWGRMDFEPNIDAVCWFVRNVFRTLKEFCPEAQLQIVGKKPAQRVLDLKRYEGVTVQGEVADIRPHAHAAAITILPMRSGAGIKNKLLEAAAMARPMLVLPRAIKGLNFDGPTQPWLVCRSAFDWVEKICRLWVDTDQRQRLAADARRWALQRHSWQTSAGEMMRWIEALPTPRAKTSSARHSKHQAPPADRAGSSILSTDAFKNKAA